MKLTWKSILKIVGVSLAAVALIKVAAANDVPFADTIADALGLDY